MIPSTVIAGILTMAWPYARTTGSLVAVAILYGMASGAFGESKVFVTCLGDGTDSFYPVGLLILPVTNMGELGDVGRRQGMLFSIVAIGAILGPPISGLIQKGTGGYVAVGFYAGTF